MDFFTSRQSGVFDSINYGTWAESSFTGQSIESKQGSYVNSTVSSTVTYSGSTSASQGQSIINQHSSETAVGDLAVSRGAIQYTNTTFSNSFSNTDGYTIQEVIKDTSSYRRETIGTETGATTFTNTQLDYATGTISSIGQIGLSLLTSNATGAWDNYITSTSSYSVSTISTKTGSQTSYSTSFSKWNTVGSDSTVGVSLTTTSNTNSSITYAYTTSTQGLSSTFTKTNHFISPYVDTVILANAGKNSTNYNIGNQIWIISETPAIPYGSTFGRFSQLFGSFETNYFIVSYKPMWKTEKGFEATAITFSQNTRTVNVSGSGASTTTSQTTAETLNTAGQTTTTTVEDTTYVRFFTSYNGVEYTALNNSKTETITRNLGDVSTSASGTSIVFYSTFQASGYNSNNSFTTAIETNFAESTSITTKVNKFWNSAQSFESAYSRKTTTDEILYSLFLTSGTDLHFAGFKKTTTTNAYLAQTTVTNPIWIQELNPIVSRYTTNSISNYSGGYDSTGMSIGETLILTLWTATDYTPVVWTNPYIDKENVAVYRSPPIGYAGAGGNFNASNLAVYSSISIGLVDGGAYGTEQTLNSYDLPTALAYDNVTIFPDSISSTNHPYGAYSMRYLSTNTSVGSRLVGVTWSTTTQTDYTLKDITGGTTLTTTQTNVAKPATYSIAPIGLITGDFYSSGEITFNTSDVRMDNNFSGGYALGNNAIGSDYTVSLGSGYVEWTAYDSTGSVSSNKSQGVGGSVSFTVPSSLAIVLNAEPILSMSWKDGSDTLDHISQSYQYFPT